MLATVVIGGVMTSQQTTTVQQVPVVGSVPLIGHLFKRTAVNVSSQELLFFLTPRIMKSTVDLPGSAVLVALALGGAVAGLVGALVAVPSAALAAVLIDEYVVKNREL